MRVSWFNRWFPPPAYLALPAVGLDISDRSIKFCQLAPAGGRLVIKQFGEHPLGVEVVENGHIKNPTQLTEALKNLAAEHGFSQVAASLPEEHAYIVEIKLPPLRPEHIRGSVELQLEDHVPLSAAEVFFDYEVAPAAAAGRDQTGVRAVVAAMSRQVVLAYESVITGAGLTPLSFEVEAHAITRAVLNPEERAATLLVDFGKTRTSFFVVVSGLVLYTATASHIGGEILTQALVKDLHLPYPQAEQLKIESGLLRSRERQNDVVFALLPAVSVLRDEILTRYQYWQTQSSSAETNRRIEKILLCGGQATLPGLVEYLNTELPVPVELGSVWTNIMTTEAAAPPISFNQSFKYATAIGLGLRALAGFAYD